MTGTWLSRKQGLSDSTSDVPLVDEAVLTAACGAVWGRTVPADAGDRLLEAFRRAGFSEARTVEGVKMLATGRYAGFRDAALSMVMFGRGESRNVTSERVREAAEILKRPRAVSESSSERRVSPWDGRR